MNKLTKLLSVFVIAGAMVGAGAIAGCKTTPEHTHDYQYVSDGADGHHQECKDGDDTKSTVPHRYADDNDTTCEDCDYVRTLPGAEVVVSELIVTGKNVFVQGSTFSKEGIVVTAIYTDGTEEDVTAKATFSTPDLTQIKKQTITIEYGGKQIEYSIMVSDPKFEGWTAISSVEEFNAFRTLSESSENFFLTEDIDLEGIELEATKVMFTGKFDGNGYTIKNGLYKEGASNKTGLLVRQLNNGGSVNNVKFLNCNAIWNGETIGIVAGMSEGTVTVSKVEFNGCTVQCNNYAGLCIGRTNSKDSKVTLQEITAKNGVTSTVSSYGGTLIGDIAAGNSATERAELNIIDCDLEMELKGSNGNGGFLSGRIRSNTNFNVKNVILRSAVCPSATGLVCGGGNNNAGNSTVKVENLYVMSTNAAGLQSCALPNATNPVTTFEITYTNCYVSGEAPKDYVGAETSAYLTAVDKATANVDWLKDTLKLDFTDVWTVEENDPTMYRLAASSTNVKSADATIKSLKLATANAQVRFEKGTDYSSTGLSVTGIYSDGVNLVLKAEEGYTVDTTAYDKTKAGKYTITVKSVEDDKVVATYEVEVVEQTSFVVDTQFAKLAYVLGEKIDLSKLLVYANWSDNQSVLTTNYTTNADQIDMTTAGAKKLTVTMEGFEAKTVKLSVIDTKPEIKNGAVTINVDASATLAYAGAKVEGVETFNTINEAVDYLAAAAFDDDVDKIMYIANGTYTEKITIPATLKNLKMVGQSIENTKIEYDAVEDSVNPLNGSKYTMDCATLHVNAENFTLENITVNNTFDYINLSNTLANPQGFALTINADGAVINKVTLYGNQDTLFFKKGRVYLKDSTIIGNVDFIFGENDGLAFFDNCTIKAITRSKTALTNNGYVTAMKGDATNNPTYGYIFSGCHFTDDGNLLEGSMSLGRPWGPGASVAMINCDFSKAYSTAAYADDDSVKSRWFSMSGNSPVNAHYYEYGSTGEGAITEAVRGGAILTADEAANYTAANLFAMTNGGVTWKTPWAGTNEKVTVTIKVGTEDVYVGRVCKGIKLNAELAAEWFEVEDMVLTGLYTDADCTTAFDYATAFDTAMTLYGTYTEADPTLKESFIYTYSQDGREDGTEVKGEKKLTFTGLVVNNSWLRFKDNDSSISFTAAEGTMIAISVYGGEVLTFNGTEVSATEDKVVGYIVPADGEVVIKRKAGTNAYLRTISISVPLSESYTYTYAQDGRAQGDPEPSNGKVIFTKCYANGDWLRYGGEGSSIAINLRKGSTLKFTRSPYDGGVVSINGTEQAAQKEQEIVYTATETGLVEITATASSYFKTFSVDVPAKSKTYTYTHGGENGEEWATDITDSNLPLVEAGGATSTDETQRALKVAYGKYLTLTASGTKATVTVTGFTTASGNPSEFLLIEFLDASGSVVATLKGTTTQGKVMGAYTFTSNVVESETAFASVRFTCGTSGKHMSIKTLSIEVE